MPSFNFPIGSVLRCQTIIQAPGQIAVLTHKFQLFFISGGANFNSGAFLADYDSQVSLLYLPILSNSASYYGTSCYLMNPTGPPPRPDTINTNAAAGTAGAGILPTQTTGLTSWYTDLLGKQGQGRTYFPFPAPASNQSDGTPTTQYLSDLATVCSAIRTVRVVIDGAVTGHFEKVLYQGGIATALPVTGQTVRDAWATQRRRGAFGRLNSLPF